VARDGAGTVVRIANTGSFIPPEEQAKIFTLFYTTRRGGSGFGLPQARRALADHGGDIEVTSSREQGTAFVLRFPDQAVLVSSERAQQPAREPSSSVSRVAF
jgi:signal transduction histidine kinase